MDKDRLLQGGIGGYGRVSLFGSQVQLSFADINENKLIKDNIEDSTFVDFMSFSVSSVTDIFHKPLMKLGHLKGMMGIGYYEISHKSLSNDGAFIDRIATRDNLIHESTNSRFAGAMIRCDFITIIKNDSFPLFQLHTQVNAYKGNSSWQLGGGINYKNLGFDFTYKHSVDNVDWAPKDEAFLSFNYSFDMAFR